jgi:serine/threonine protein kinase
LPITAETHPAGSLDDTQSAGYREYWPRLRNQSMLSPGVKLSHYEILGPLGSGGMGQVYHARDDRLDREVAIKVLHDDFAGDPAWLTRFEREGRLLAALNHPNIAILHELEMTQRPYFLVMELVQGETLADRISRGPLPFTEALTIGRQIAEALEAAHDKGIVHRDLKPANVKVTPEGKCKVLDFGLAKSEGAVALSARTTVLYQEQTGEGTIVGTPAYMSPEQARGKPLDKRSDIWSFGCVLYESLVGHPPFHGETYSDILAGILERIPDWQGLPPDLPPRLVELVRRCLQKDPQRRLRDIGDARLEIDEVLNEMTQATLQPAVAQVSKRPPRSGVPWSFVLIALLLALVAFPLGMWTHSLRVNRSLPSTAVPAWSGQHLLGGSTHAFGPRVSPDGQSLAFLVVQEGQTQLGVMKLSSGEWRILTRDRSRGSILSLCWSADSNRIYYDRFNDVPMGVYRISSFDTQPQEDRLVAGAEKAECPQVLPDGSLLICKSDARFDSRFYRCWPGGEKELQLILEHAMQASAGWPAPVRALRTRNEAVFWAKLYDGTDANPRRYLYLLNLDTGKTRRLVETPLSYELIPLAVTPDDRFAITVLQAGDVTQVVRVPLTGDAPVQTVLTLTERPYGLDIDKDGTLFIDQFHRPLEMLRFPEREGTVEQIATVSQGRLLEPVELPDGRVLLSSTVFGRDRLLLSSRGKDGKEPTPLLDEGAPAHPPAALVGSNRLAFLADTATEGRRQVMLAQIEDGQIRPGKRLPETMIPGTGLGALAASYDGKEIYYVHDKAVWAVPADGGQPRRLTDGEGVAAHPNGKELVVQRFEGQGVRMFRLTLAGGMPEEIKTRGPLRLAPHPIGARAIDKAGRALVTVASPESWFWRTGLLDLETGQLDLIRVAYDGDMYPANWGTSGKVLAVGSPLKSDLWRFVPQE